MASAGFIGVGTQRLRQRNGSPISATVAPAFEDMVPGQAVNTIANYADITDPLNYQSEGATVVTARVQINGVDVGAGTDTISDGDAVSVLVTDSLARTRAWFIDNNVTYPAPVAGSLAAVVETQDVGQTVLVNVAAGFTGDALQYSVPASAWYGLAGSTLTINLDDPRTATIPITVTNSGGSAQVDLSVTINPLLVQLAAPIADQTFAQNSGDVTIDLRTVFNNATAYGVSGSASVSIDPDGFTLRISDDSLVTDDTVTVTGSNANNSVQDQFQLTIAAVVETDFVMIVETTAPDEVFLIPFRNEGTYNATLDWGDGSSDTITAFDDPNRQHTYATPGTHTIRLSGQIGGIRFNTEPVQAAKIRSITNMGQLSWANMGGVAYGLVNASSVVLGDTDAGGAVNWGAFAQGPLITSGGPKTIDLTGVDMSGVQFLGSAFKNNNSLTSLPGHEAAFAGCAPVRLDEMLRNCAGLDGYNLDLSGMSIENFAWLGANPLTGAAFDVITPAQALATAGIEATLIAWSNEATTKDLNVDRIPIGFGVTPITGAAAQAAIANLEARGYWVTTGYNRVPDTPSAPTVTDGADGFVVTFPSVPFGYGRPVTVWDVRYSTDEATWTVVDEVTDGATVNVAEGTYFVQVRATNFDGDSAWSTSDTVAVIASKIAADDVTIEGETDPLFNIPSELPDSQAISVTIDSIVYTQDYASTPLTAGLFRAGPVRLTRPTISGTETEGQTLTATPGIILNLGADPGDQTFAWQNDADGATGQTTLSYTLVAGDVGDTISVEETYLGVTVSSASTAVIAAGITSPDAFVDANWSVATGDDRQLDITIASLPADNGTAITDVEYELDASGIWASLPGYAGPGTYAIIVADPNTSYDVRLRAVNGHTGVAGNTETAISGDVPVIISSTPANNATDIAIGANITITFDQPIQFGDTAIVLRENNGGWADLEIFTVSGPGSNVGTGPGSVSISGNTLTIEPTADLATSREYAIQISSTAIDSRLGNPFAGISDDTTLSFTTVSGVFDPAALFSGGREGFWLDFTDTSTLWQEAARTNAADTNGDVVAYIDDKSGNGHDWEDPAALGNITRVDSGGDQYLDVADDRLRMVVDYDTTSTANMHFFIGLRSSTGRCVLAAEANGTFIALAVSGNGASPTGSGVGSPTFAVDGGADISPVTRGQLFADAMDGTDNVLEIKNFTIPANQQLQIGYSWAIANDFVGRIYEVIAVDSPTVDERSDIVAHIQGKF